MTADSALNVTDFGLKPLRSPQDEDLHDLISERYEQHATIVTSNLDLSEWGDAFPNRLLGAATIDRLRHGAYKVVLEGKSFRCMRPDQKKTKSTSVMEVTPKNKSKKKPDGPAKGFK